MKQYRVDAFVCGRHSKRYFSSRERAERFGRKQNDRGELVFLLKKMNGSNLYDVIHIFS